MSEEALLTTLCTICHVNPIKYTCPRCGIHTCSLPCVKKHKSWAQCSGVRNPAEYRKRSELETSSSIDKDFNFIAKVERAVQHADNERVNRKFNLAPARQPRPNQQKPKIEIELEQRNVKVVKAPSGLSRSKQNKTHWANQQKCVMWTIEWVQPDGEKIVGQVLETKCIGEAYLNAVGKKNVLRKRKRDKVFKPMVSNSVEADDVVEAAGKKLSSRSTMPSGNEALYESSHLGAANGSPQQSNGLLDGLHFYLHRPNTTAKLICLVPLQQSDILKDILQHRTIIEFPTVHVRNKSPSDLTSPFMLEAEYLKKDGEALAGPQDLFPENKETREPATHPTSDKSNEQKLLEILAKDLAD